MCWAREVGTGKSVLEHDKGNKDYYDVGRHLCELTDQEAREEVANIFWRYVNNNEDINLETAVAIYSPSYENDTAQHAYCISEKSGVNLKISLRHLLTY